MAVPMEPKQPITPRPNTTSLSHTRLSALIEKTQQLKSLKCNSPHAWAHTGPQTHHAAHYVSTTITTILANSRKHQNKFGHLCLTDSHISSAGFWSWMKVLPVSWKQNIYCIIISLKWSHGPSDKIYICIVAWENPHKINLICIQYRKKPRW